MLGYQVIVAQSIRQNYVTVARSSKQISDLDVGIKSKIRKLVLF